MVDHRHARPLPEGPGIFISEVLVIVQNHTEVDMAKTMNKMIAQWWNSRDTQILQYLYMASEPINTTINILTKDVRLKVIHRGGVSTSSKPA